MTFYVPFNFKTLFSKALLLVMSMTLLTACDNGLKGVVGSKGLRPAASINTSNLSVKEGEGITLAIFLNDPSTTNIAIKWSVNDPNGRLVAAKGTTTILVGQTSAAIYFQAKANTIIDGDELLDFDIRSSDLKKDLEGQINVLDQTRPAVITISSSPLYDFSTVSTGLQASHLFTVSNTGDATATSMAYAGLASPFNFLGATFPGTSGTCSNALAGHSSCTFALEYHPTVDGASSGTLTINYNDGAVVQAAPIDIQGFATTVAASFNATTLPVDPSNLTALNVQVQGAGITQYRYKVILSSGDCTDSTGYSAFRPVGTNITDNISALVDGTIRICAVGSDGTLSQSYSYPTVYSWVKDTIAPTSSSITIAAAANYITTLPTTLTLSSVGATDMYITNSAGCAAGGTWETYNTSKAWTLPTANSINTIYAGFRDTAGNSVCVSDTITHDAQNPNAVTSVTLGTTPLGLTTSPSFSFANATDVGPAGIASYQAEIYRTSDNAVIKSWTTLISGDQISGLTLADTTQYYVKVRALDNAGNISATQTSASWSSYSSITATLTGTPTNPSNTTVLGVTVGGIGVTGYSYKLGVAATTDCTDSTGYSGSLSTGTAITDSIAGLADGSIKLCAVGTNGSAWQAYAAATAYTWTKDTVAPTSPSVIIEAGATYVTTLNSTLTLSASAANEMYITGTAGCGSGGSWEPYATSKPWTLINSNNTNLVYVKFRDQSQNETACVNDSIIHDGSGPNAPTALSLGATPSSLSQTPTLTFTASTDVGPSGVFAAEVRIVKNSDSSEVLTWQTFTSATSITGLSLVQDEVYKFELRSVDNAGNIGAVATSSTWIASNPATATLTGAPTGTNNTTVLAVTVAGTGITNYKYKVGLFASTDCTVAAGYSVSTPIATLITDDISALTDGAVKLCVVGYNGSVWQSYASATSANWTKDATAPTSPTISINSAAVYSATTTATITLSAVSADEMYITNVAGCASGGAWEAYSTSKAWTLGQTDSTATVYVAFRDLYGNSTSCINDTIIEDQANPNPVTGLTLGVVPASVTDSPSVTYTAASDIGPSGVAKYQVQVHKTSDSSVVAVWADHVSGDPVSSLSLTDGQQYYVKVRTLDNAGNISTLVQSANWTVNGTLGATFTGTPTNPSNVTTLNVTVGGTGVNEYKFKVGASGSTDCTNATGYSSAIAVATLIATDISALADGSLKICAVGGDGIGTFQAYGSASSYTWVKDTTAPTSPTISINAAATYTNSTAATATLSAVSATEMYLTSVAGCGSGGAWEAYATSKAITLAQTNATATYYVSYRDASGNVSACANDTIVHDNVVPTNATALTIGSVSAKLFETPTLTFTSGTDAGSGIQKHQIELRKADNSLIAAYADFTSGSKISGVSLTSATQYYFKIRTYDNAGNISSEVSSANFTAAAPVVTLSGQPTGTNNTTVLNITASGTDITEYKYKVGATGSTTCSSATGYSGSGIAIATLITDNITAIADGSVTLCAVGGNGTDWQDYASATSISWTKDTTAPTLPALTINGTTSGYTTSTSATLAPFAVSASEMYITPTAGCASGGAWEAYAVSKSYTLTVNSINTVYVRFRDASGNNSTCVSATSTHDALAPNSPTALTLGATPMGLSTSPTLSWTSASDNGPAGIQKYQARLIKTSDSSQIVAWQDFTSTSNLSGLSLLDNTGYTFELKSIDNAGNASSAVQSQNFTTYTTILATLAGTPSAQSNTTALDVTVAGNSVTQYKYKVGISASTDCSSATGYSASGIAVATHISDALGADGNYKLCVVGSNGSTWQTYAAATSFSWVKDTASPQITNITASSDGPFKSGDVITFTVTFNESATASTPANARLVNSSPATITALYSSGSGTASWVFTYTVTGSDNYADLQLDRVSMTSGTISDAIPNSGAPITWISNLASVANVVIDTTAPTANSIVIAAGATYTTTNPVALTLAATGATQMYITNTASCASGGTWETYATSKASWTLAQTNSTATVYAQYRDAVGNLSTCTNDTIIHDSIVPTDPSSLVVGAVAAKLFESPTLTFTASSDSGSGVSKYQAQILRTSDSLVITSFADFTSGSKISGLTLTSGTQYYFKLKGFDNAGNVSTLVSSSNWTASAPTAVLTGTPANPTNVTTLNVTVSGTDITFYSYKVGASGSTDCTSATGYSATVGIATLITSDTSGFSDGSLKLCVIGSNGTDWQTYAAATSYTWVQDTAAPSLPALTINGASSGYTTATAATLAPFAVGASDMYITPTAGCASGGAWEAYAVSKAYTLTANTINNVYVKFRDAATNVSVCVTASSTHDNQAPNTATALVLGTTPVGLTTTPTLSWTSASDVGPAGVAKYQARLIKNSDSSQIVAWQDLTSGSNFSSLSLADATVYKFELRTHDNAGNTSTVVQSATFTTYAAITATLSGTPANPSNVTTLNVTVGGINVSGYAYKVGVTASTDCTNATGYSGQVAVATLITSDISGLADGSLSLCVVGTNGTAWQSYASATTYTWVKDTTAPTFTLFQLNSNATYAISTFVTANFTTNATGTDQMLLTQNADCSTGGTFVTYANSSSFTIAATQGVQTVYAKLKDAAGNISSCLSDTIILDTVIPTVTITRATYQPTTSGSAPVDFNVQFSEPVNFVSFLAANITNSGTATIGRSELVNISTSQAIYRVYSLSAGGTIIPQITLPNAALDIAGNAMAAYTSPDTVTLSPSDVTLRFTDIKAGANHTCALSSGGDIYCWGLGTSGQLGPNSPTTSSSVPVLTGHGFVSLDVGSDHACAIDSFGKIFCWGANANGELGNNTTTDSSTMVLVDTTNVTGSKRFSSVSVGASHACAITLEADAYCWGNNGFGRLGDNSSTARLIPVAVNTSLMTGATSFRKISAGYNNTCGISTSGTAYCWGNGSASNMGDSTTTASNKPKAVTTSGFSSFPHVRDIASGDIGSCLISELSNMYCWGTNTYGIIGDNTLATKALPTAINTVSISATSAFLTVSSRNHSCGLTADGLIYCWGENAGGKVGDNTTVDKKVPTPVNLTGVTGNKTFISIDTGGGHSCALTAEGIAYCWGTNTDGQVGDNSTTARSKPVAVLTSAIKSTRYFTKVVGGPTHSCGIMDTGRVHCWGDNTYGQLGTGNNTQVTTPTAVDVSGVVGSGFFREISVSESHTCGIATDGYVLCWGRNNYSKLGIGGTTDSNVPKKYVRSGDLYAGARFLQVTAGYNHSCFTDEAGYSYCLGLGTSGQVGNGASSSQSTFKANDATNFASTQIYKIKAGNDFTCAVAYSGKTLCWGLGTSGQIGNTASANVNIPTNVVTTSVGGFGQFIRIEPGEGHTCGIATGGKMYCWGKNTTGQLGNNTTVNNATLQEVVTSGISGFTAFKTLTAGVSHSCAIAQNGQPYCWGAGVLGQLGDNGSATQLTAVSTLINEPADYQGISNISGGGNHSFLFNAFNQLTSWGSNSNGQLGISSTTDSAVPVRTNIP